MTDFKIDVAADDKAKPKWSIPNIGLKPIGVLALLIACGYGAITMISGIGKGKGLAGTAHDERIQAIIEQSSTLEKIQAENGVVFNESVAADVEAALHKLANESVLRETIILARDKAAENGENVMDAVDKAAGNHLRAMHHNAPQNIPLALVLEKYLVDRAEKSCGNLFCSFDKINQIEGMPEGSLLHATINTLASDAELIAAMGDMEKRVSIEERGQAAIAAKPIFFEAASQALTHDPYWSGSGLDTRPIESYRLLLLDVIGSDIAAIDVKVKEPSLTSNPSNHELLTISLDLELPAIWMPQWAETNIFRNHPYGLELTATCENGVRVIIDDFSHSFHSNEHLIIETNSCAVAGA